MKIVEENVNKDSVDKTKYSISFRINKVSIALSDEITEYLLFSIKEVNFQSLVRFSSQNLKFSIESSKLFNKFSKSFLFPKLLSSEYFLIEYDNQKKIFFKINSGDLKFFVDIDFMFHLSSLITNILHQDLDFANYFDLVSETTERYLTQSQNYIKEIIEKGINRYDIEIEIKAPLIVIPLNAETQDAPVFFFDLGKFTAKTTSKSVESLDYDAYQFELCSFRIFTKNIDSYKDILFPVTANASLFTCKVLQFEEPGLCLRVFIEKFEVLLTDTNLALIVDLKNNLKKLFIFPFYEENKFTNSENLIEKNLYQIEIKDLSITLIEKNIPLTLLCLNNTKLKAETGGIEGIKGKIIFGKTELKDLRTESK